MAPFRPNRGPLKLSPNMIIENLAKVLDISADTVDSIANFEDAAAAEPARAAAAAGTGLRVWSVEEAAAAAGEHGLFAAWASPLSMHCIVKLNYNYPNAGQSPLATG